MVREISTVNKKSYFSSENKRNWLKITKTFVFLLRNKSSLKYIVILQNLTKLQIQRHSYGSVLKVFSKLTGKPSKDIFLSCTMETGRLHFY